MEVSQEAAVPADLCVGGEGGGRGGCSANSREVGVSYLVDLDIVMDKVSLEPV
jgi:hypothetical protein